MSTAALLGPGTTVSAREAAQVCEPVRKADTVRKADWGMAAS